MRSPPVDEYEYLPRERISVQARAHQTAEPVKTLAHVGGRAVEAEVVIGTQQYHACVTAPCSKGRRNEGEAGT